MPELSVNVLGVNIVQGLAAFVATNLDDVVVLMVFFGQMNSAGRARNIVAGQYLGFALLILLSLPGYFGGRLVAPQWIGLLGLVPLGIGIKLLFANDASEEEQTSTQTVSSSRLSRLLAFLPPQILQVAAVTVANGGDNIGIYVPLFASKNLEGLLTILGVFAVMVGVWCYVAWRLIRQPSIGQVFNKYGDRLVPGVFIILGGYILWESGTITYFSKSFFNL
jgi:cadmium resistance transport/sequestration family protein